MKHAYYSLFLIYILLVSVQSKGFFDAASEEIAKGEDRGNKYDSLEYRKEPDSLNQLYYTEKGRDELTDCRKLYAASYNRCSELKTCNFCSANPDCGWCNEKKICLPIDLNSRQDQFELQCQGDCITILKIDSCYKSLYEPENNADETNFSNYPQETETSQDIVHGPVLNNLKHESDANPEEAKKYQEDLTPANDDVKIQNEKFADQETFSNKNFNKRDYEFIKPNLDKKEDPMEHMKEFIPNFNFPQFVESDLESSIQKIEKEKLLLWLRGYSLNEPQGKKHLPILKDLYSEDEDKLRKEVLGKFYDKILNNKTKTNTIQGNSQDNNLINSSAGPANGTPNNNSALRRDNEANIKKEKPIAKHVINSKYIDQGDLFSLVKRNNMRFKQKQTKSFAEIRDELKHFLQDMK